MDVIDLVRDYVMCGLDDRIDNAREEIEPLREDIAFLLGAETFVKDGVVFLRTRDAGTFRIAVERE